MRLYIIIPSCLALILFVLYMFVIRPGKNSKSRMKGLLGWDYAHRGLHDSAKGIYENTMTAFENAVKKGYGIELDIMTTRDGQIVVFHDFNLFRMCRLNRRVDELDYEEISGLSIHGSNAGIPLFKDVLGMVGGRVPLIIEIKSEKRNGLLCKKINELLDSYKGVYCIESFNAFIVYWYSQNRPDILRGQLSMNFTKKNKRENRWQKFLLKNLLINFLQKPDFISYKSSDRKNLSLWLCKKVFGSVCVGWTITSQLEYNIAMDFFDVVIFEGFIPK